MVRHFIVFKGVFGMSIAKSREKTDIFHFKFYSVMHCLDLIFTGCDFNPTPKNLHVTLLMDGNNDIEQLIIVVIQCVLYIQMDLDNDVK